MKLAIGYIRVSSKGQRDEGLSPDAQEKVIREWAEKNGYVLYEPIFSDNGKSGGKLSNRPGAKAAIDKACELHTVIVVWSLSRLFRNWTEAGLTLQRIQKANADIVSLSQQIDTTTAMGKAFFGMMAVFDQLWRDMTGENTKMILADLKAQGKARGSDEYGYMRDMSRPEKKIKNGVEQIKYPYIIECPQEQAIIAHMKHLKAIGHSTTEIAYMLSLQNMKPRNGGKWGLTQIKRILRKGE